MKLPFLEPTPPPGALAGLARDAVVEELCDRKQFALLATPYLAFHVRCMERSGEAIRLKVSFGQDSVRHALGDHPLRLRFEWSLAVHAGPTRILSFEQREKERFLNIEVPAFLSLDEQRRSPRMDRVGSSSGTLSTPEGRFFRVTLEDISSGGASIFATDPVDAEHLRTGIELNLSLALDQGPHLNLVARICHSEGQSLGLAFVNPGEADQASLAHWLEPRIQDARRRWENRAELRARAEHAARPKEQPSGILLLTQNESLVEQISLALASSHAVRPIAPAMGPLMDAQSRPPLLILVDPCRGDVEDRRRCRALLEKAAIRAPLVVLGDGQNAEAGRQLAAELKASAYLDWNPQQEVFFQRFIQGLIRAFWKNELAEL